MSIPCKLVTVALPQHPTDKTYVRLQSVSRGTYGLLSDGRVVTTEDKVNNTKIAKKTVKADIHA